MSDPFDRLGRWQILAVILSVGMGALAWSGTRNLVFGDEPRPAAGQGAVVGVALSERGTLLRRGGAEAKSWQTVSQKDKLHAGDLLVGLPGAMLESRDGTVRLDFLADLDRLSPYPIRECAVQLRQNPSLDLDVTLDRGRMDLVNRKEKGAAHARVHVRKDVFDLTLAQPGARVALEL